MKTYFASSRIAVAAASIIAVLSFSGVAQAITDTVFRYSSPRIGRYTVDHLAMAPDRTSAANSNYGNTIAGGLTTGTNDTCFVTGINLPHGAALTAVTIYYVHGASSVGDLTADFVAHPLAAGGAQTLGSRAFANQDDIRRGGNLPIGAGIVINNAQQSYGLRVCLFPFQAFYAARFTYTVNNAGE